MAAKGMHFKNYSKTCDLEDWLAMLGGIAVPPTQWWEVWKLLVYIYKKEVLASCNRLRTSRYYPTDSHTLPTRLSWHFLQKLCFLFDNVLSLYKVIVLVFTKHLLFFVFFFQHAVVVVVHCARCALAEWLWQARFTHLSFCTVVAQGKEGAWVRAVIPTCCSCLCKSPLTELQNYTFIHIHCCKIL